MWWKRWVLFGASNPEGEVENVRESYIGEYPASPLFPRRGSTLSTQRIVAEEEETKNQNYCREEPAILSRKWPTSWWWQLLVLVVRSFRQSRHVITSKLNSLQTVLLAVVVSLIWFQVPEDTSSVNDRFGYVCKSKQLWLQ